MISLPAISTFPVALVILSSWAAPGPRADQRPPLPITQIAVGPEWPGLAANHVAPFFPEGAVYSVLDDDVDSGAIDVDTDEPGGSLFGWHCLISSFPAVVSDTGVFQSETCAQRRLRFLLLCRIRC